MTITYLRDRAVVRIAGPIDDRSIGETIDAIQYVREHCFYDRVCLSISSPGGYIHAYERLLDDVEELRADGVRVDTAASGTVGGTAACLLSLGDRRRAAGGCRLRYRAISVSQPQDVDAFTAAGMASVLKEFDERMVSRLAERGVVAAKEPKKRRKSSDFHDADWLVISGLLEATGSGSKPESEGKRVAMKRLHKLLTRCGSDAASLGGIYRTLFALDLTISPVLARDLFLIDEVGRSRQSARRKRGAALRVPEWTALWPDGWIDEQYLLRHTFISGETGSGKTASGVMPLVRGMLSAPCHVGCALIVDPKRELLPAVRDLVEDVRVIEPSGPGRRASMLNLFSAPHWDVDGDLEAGLVQDAARKILTRSAELATRTPAAVWAGLEAGHPRQGYWDHEGGSLAAVALSLALAVISRRSAIFAEGDSPPSIRHAPAAVRAALRVFAEEAGIVPPQGELNRLVTAALGKASDGRIEEKKRRTGMLQRRLDVVLNEGTEAIRKRLRELLLQSGDADLDEFDWEQDVDVDLRGYMLKGRTEIREQFGRWGRHADAEESCLTAESWERFATEIKDAEIYRSNAGFRREFDALDREVQAAPDTFELEAVGDRVLLCGFIALDEGSVRPSPNIMALAQRILDLFLTPLRAANGSGEGSGSPFSRPSRDAGKNAAFRLLASALVTALKPLFGIEAEPVWSDVARWETLAGSGRTNETSPHYASVLAIAHQAFRDFAGSAPAWTLYFGVEPYWRRVVRDGSADVIDFAAAVDADEGCRVWVVQPKLGGEREVIVAKAMKAAFFEAVLGNEARASGVEKPLVAYVADEFHRFVTSGEGHGEQGFLDTCRSFRAFCALATQSVASIEHALAGTGASTAQNAAAVSILLNNVGTKLFFRTTDEGTIRRIRSLCPSVPERPRLVDVRPPSTLAPGECYAVLPDGRFERRQLAPCLPRESASATGQAAGESAPQSGKSKRRTAEVIPLSSVRRDP